jgi:hypothetical protein
MTKIPVSGTLSHTSSVQGRSGARRNTVQPAASVAASATAACRTSSSDPAAQAERISTRNIESVS